VLRDVLNEREIEEVMREQMKAKREDRKNILIILDDFAADLKNTTTLNRLAMRGRHSKVWCWISTQLYRKIPRGVRVNMPFYIFYTVNSNELRTISEELASGSIAKFEDMFRKCTAKPYSFFSINARKHVRHGRYMCNFKPLRLTENDMGSFDEEDEEASSERE
jgi:hypothetical protein